MLGLEAGFLLQGLQLAGREGDPKEEGKLWMVGSIFPGFFQAGQFVHFASSSSSFIKIPRTPTIYEGLFLA